MLNSDGYDISVVDSMSNEDLKHVIYQIQDYPSGASASHKVGGPARHFASMMGSTIAHCNTTDGARWHKAATLASVLVLARPAGTEKYSTEEQLQRAATIANSPTAFLALWLDFVRAASVQPERDEPDATDSSTPDGVRESSDEDRLKRSLFYGNRAEWGKAYQAWAPIAQRADGTNEVVQAKLLELTPQCQAPRPEMTADEPGVQPVNVRQQTINKAVKQRKSGRKGGPTIISYETLGNISSTTKGAKALHSFCNAFAQGKLHPDIQNLTESLDEMALWKDDECKAVRPIGMCDIFVRFAESCCFREVRDKADKYFTSQLPEDEAASLAAVEAANEELVSARNASSSAEATGEASLREAARRRLETAERDHQIATAPVNVPLNFVFSSRGCAMMSFTIKSWHQTEPANLTVSGDLSNMYNETDQPMDECGEPDPTGHGRERMFEFFRKRFPELLPSARLVLGAPSLLRLSRAGGPVALPGRIVSVDDLADPDPNNADLFRSCAGGVQGRPYSTLGCVGPYHETLHAVQKANKTTRFAGLADDVACNDKPAAACAAYADKVESQRRELGLRENFSKAAVYSPSGDIDCVPACLPGSPHHVDKYGNLTGRLPCFKMVGGYHGDDDACAVATTTRLAKKLQPLDVMDRARETEFIKNVSQIKHNIVRFAVAPIASFTAQITEPSVSNWPLHLTEDRIRRSWELNVAAEASPQQLRDQAWQQACLPAEGFGGCNLTSSSCTTDANGTIINHHYTASFLSCWPRLRVLLPDMQGVSPLDENAPRFVKEAIAGYNETRRLRSALETTHAALHNQKYHTLRGGKLTPYHPPALPLAETLPPAAELLDPTSKLRTPSSGKLASVQNISAWHQHKANLHAQDLQTARDKINGSSAVKHREASRLISTSMPYATAWHSVPPDGTTGTKIATPQWRASMQRQLGLHLSEAKPALVELAKYGETVDFFGDDASNNANHNRRHNACLTAWYNAISAVATTQTVLGDKAHGARTKQFNDFNDGHVVDIAEIGSGDSGEDTCVECKVFSSLTKSGGAGRGGVNGGTTAAVGHTYGFGNTEEPCRVANLGCKPRGRQSDGPFDHNTGKGWVKGKQGEYHDALFNKNNRVEIVLHEHLGGGFSPPAAQKMRRNGRKAKDHGVDRTPYQGDRKISYVSYHTRAISMGITKAESRTLIDAAHHAKGRLCRMRVGAPAALA
jgi:hypothetical protein